MTEFRIVRSDKLSRPNNIRFIVVNHLGITLDDANGYGYKTINKARNCYLQKLRRKVKDQ